MPSRSAAASPAAFGECHGKCNDARSTATADARTTQATRPRPVASMREHTRITVGRPAAYR
ncbi:hypothetical protein WT53_18960 [Burkholderia sp. MSMB2157WGS]|nr:hypothetical protein WT53_18960 [Burkholderia sp. MSMB2157WGS]